MDFSDISKREESPAIILIAGNIGAGKTTLTARLAEAMGWTAFFEPNDENPYLAKYYEDKHRWGFHCQLSFFSRRVRAYREMAAHSSVAIQDRSLFEDADIFTRMVYEDGYISAAEHAMYRDLYASCVALLPPPSFVVYLRASVSTLEARVRARGRAYEAGVGREYLERLHNLYEAWAAEFSLCPLVTLETDELNFAERDEDFAIARDRVADALDAWRQEHLLAPR